MLTFKTCDFVHEVRTDRIEGKPKNTTNQDSQKKNVESTRVKYLLTL